MLVRGASFLMVMPLLALGALITWSASEIECQGTNEKTRTPTSSSNKKQQQHQRREEDELYHRDLEKKLTNFHWQAQTQASNRVSTLIKGASSKQLESGDDQLTHNIEEDRLTNSKINNDHDKLATQIHELMSESDLRRTFQVETHDQVPEYEILKITSIKKKQNSNNNNNNNLNSNNINDNLNLNAHERHKRDSVSSGQSLDDNYEDDDKLIVMKVNTFGKEIKLRLKRNVDFQQRINDMKMFMAESTKDGQLRYIEVEQQQQNNKQPLQTKESQAQVHQAQEEGTTNNNNNHNKQVTSLASSHPSRSQSHESESGRTGSASEQPIGSTYHDEENLAALLIDQDTRTGHYRVDGTIGNDFVIKPMPLSAIEALNQAAASSRHRLRTRTIDNKKQHEDNQIKSSNKMKFQDLEQQEERNNNNSNNKRQKQVQLNDQADDQFDDGGDDEMKMKEEDEEQAELRNKKMSKKNNKLKKNKKDSQAKPDERIDGDPMAGQIELINVKNKDINNKRAGEEFAGKRAQNAVERLVDLGTSGQNGPSGQLNLDLNDHENSQRQQLTSAAATGSPVISSHDGADSSAKHPIVASSPPPPASAQQLKAGATPQGQASLQGLVPGATSRDPHDDDEMFLDEDEALEMQHRGGGHPTQALMNNNDNLPQQNQNKASADNNDSNNNNKNNHNHNNELRKRRKYRKFLAQTKVPKAHQQSDSEPATPSIHRAKRGAGQDYQHPEEEQLFDSLNDEHEVQMSHHIVYRQKPSSVGEHEHSFGLGQELEQVATRLSKAAAAAQPETSLLQDPLGGQFYLEPGLLIAGSNGTGTNKRRQAKPAAAGWSLWSREANDQPTSQQHDDHNEQHQVATDGSKQNSNHPHASQQFNSTTQSRRFKRHTSAAASDAAPGGGQASLSNRRQKRQAPDTVWPEVLLVVDYDSFLLHGGDSRDVKRYFVSFWNGVDLRYKLLAHPHIRISLAGMIVAKDRDATPYLERNRLRAPNADAVDAAGALTDMGKYLYREDRLPTYDLAVVITKLDMCRRRFDGGRCNRGTAGFAYVGGACVVNKRLEKVNSVAIIEDSGGFSGIIVAAHEVGHLLGCVHDGSPPPNYLGGPGATHCPWEDGFIMSDLRHTERGFRWSHCSVDQFKHFLHGETATCLYNYPHESQMLHRLLPGTMLSLDEQCKRDRGTNACFKDARVCAQLFCFDSASGYCVSYRPAAEGSPCGEGQVCRNGKCVGEIENIIPDYSHQSQTVVARRGQAGASPASSSPVLAAASTASVAAVGGSSSSSSAGSSPSSVSSSSPGPMAPSAPGGEASSPKLTSRMDPELASSAYPPGHDYNNEPDKLGADFDAPFNNNQHLQRQATPRTLANSNNHNKRHLQPQSSFSQRSGQLTSNKQQAHQAHSHQQPPLTSQSSGHKQLVQSSQTARAAATSIQPPAVLSSPNSRQYHAQSGHQAPIHNPYQHPSSHSNNNKQYQQQAIMRLHHQQPLYQLVT